MAALAMLEESTELRDKLMENTCYFRAEIARLGFAIQPGEHPIVPILLGDARLASQMADLLLAKGVYVIGFSYPVVPHGKARIRTQISAAHEKSDLEFALTMFTEAKRELGV
jgi:glycine C-acetyltransferase